MAKKLRCYLRLHRWQKKRDDADGTIYYECRDCQKLREFYDEPPLPGGFINPPG